MVPWRAQWTSAWNAIGQNVQGYSLHQQIRWQVLFLLLWNINKFIWGLIMVRTGRELPPEAIIIRGKESWLITTLLTANVNRRVYEGWNIAASWFCKMGVRVNRPNSCLMTPSSPYFELVIDGANGISLWVCVRGISFHVCVCVCVLSWHPVRQLSGCSETSS